MTAVPVPRLALVLGLSLASAGCMASERIENQSATYTNSWLLVLAMGGLGLLLAITGTGMALEAKSRIRSSRTKRRRESAPPPPSTSTLCALGLGVCFALGGVFLLSIAAPSAALAYITVGEDRLIIRDSFLWWAGGPREIPFGSILDVEYEEQEVLARRGRRKKEYMHILHQGGAEHLEMGAIHRAARARFDEALAAWRAKHPAPNPLVALHGEQHEPDDEDESNTEESAPGAAAAADRQPPLETAFPDETGMTPVRHLGRFTPGATILASRGGQFVQAEVLRVYRERQLKVRFPDGSEATVPVDAARVMASAVPAPETGPGTAITGQTDIRPGATLLAHYGGNWYPVEIVRLDGSQNVVVTWIGEGIAESIARSRLRASPPGQVQAVLNEAVPRLTDDTPLPEVPGGPQISASRPAAEKPGKRVRAKSILVAGDKLLAEWAGRWLPVEVVEVQDEGKVLIHWIGYSDAFDEVIERDKLRFRVGEER